MNEFEKRLTGSTSDWSRSQWIQNKEHLNGCVSIHGALLSHSDPDYIYIAPAPTRFSVVVELRKNAIADFYETGEVLYKFDQSYRIAELFIRSEALVVTRETHAAADLPTLEAYLNSLAASPKDVEALDDSASDRGDGHSPHPSPSPRPEPRPRPRPEHPLPTGNGTRG